MYIGIDLGTSSVKAVLVDEIDGVVATASASVETSRPRPLWSEQDPEAWWRATCAAVGILRGQENLGNVRAIGLPGPMHGATLLDAADRPLRPS